MQQNRIKFGQIVFEILTIIGVDIILAETVQCILF
jgi:hypothetical protein